MPPASKVGILVIDDDERSQAALRLVLDTEGCYVRIVPAATQVFAELAGGNWKLVIANVTMTGLEGPLFTTLKELAQAPPVEAGRTRVRVLFLVPEQAGAETQLRLEHEQLPYALKPFHLHDFLEKVSDLLLETHAIAAPIRRVRHESKGAARSRRVGDKGQRWGRERRDTSMFASRDAYMMTEEEIAEFERQEEEERKKKKKKPEDAPL